MADVSLLFNILAKDQTGAALNSAGGKFSKFERAVKVGSMAAAGALAVGAAAAVSAASDYTEASNKVDAVFKEQADQVRQFEAEATKSWGISKKAALDYTSAMGSVLVASGVNRAEAAKLSVQYTKLAADLGSFNNTSTEEAAEALRAALTGEVEQMKKYGVVLNETVLKAEALSSGLIKNEVDVNRVKAAQIKHTLAQQKYNEALREHGRGSEEALRAEAALATAEGTLNKAMAGKVGQLDAATKRQAIQNVIMKATADAQGDVARNTDTAAFKQRELQARMDNLQVSIGQKLLPVYIQFLGALQSAADWVDRNQTTVKVLVGVLAGLWAGLLAVTVAQKTWAAVSVAATVATRAWTVAQTLMNVTLLGCPLILIVAGIVALVAVIVLIATKTNWFQRIWSAAWGAIKAAPVKVFNWVKSNWPLLLAILTGPIGLAVLAIVKNFNKIVSTAKALPGKVISAIGNLGSMLYQHGLDFIQGFINGIVDKAKSIPGAIKDKVVGVAKSALHGFGMFGSPSRLSMRYGRWWSEGFAIGMKDKASDIADKARELVANLKSKLDEVKDFARGIRDAFREAANPTGLDTGEDKSFGTLLTKLQQQRDAAREFAAGIGTLRQRGLNELTLGQLRDGGIGSLDTVRALLSGDIGAVNALVGDIDRTGAAFGNSEAKNRFGIDPSRSKKIRIELDIRTDDEDLKKRLRKMVRAEGGNVQVVFGGSNR